MKRFVVDASVAMKWFIPEIHSPAAARLLEEQLHLCAPDLLVPELGNTLWKKMRRQEVSRSEAAEIVRAIEIMPLEIFPSLPLLDGAFEIATSLNRTVYDSFYLALAVAQNCPLVTADSRLHAAARSSPLAPHVAWVEDEL
jgi:predicted nucleic acid-binding protein